MKFRPQRATLADAMNECVELPPMKEALTAHLRKTLGYTEAELVDIKVEKYGVFDERIGWDTYIVTAKDTGVLGFTDGPLTHGWL